MKPSAYREQDYAFGQLILTLRSAMGLSQAGLAQALGVSRRSVADWEAGAKYPKAAHLKQFVTLAVAHQAFQTGHEADAIRALWKAARQKELLNEAWLSDLLSNAQAPGARPAVEPAPTTDRAVAAAVRVEQKPTNNLPLQPTTFVGRSTELAAIARLLANPTCRLLTLHGPGGIGKTRLALTVAASETAAFPDGVAFVALASISMPSQIVSAIGEALRLSFGGQADPIAHLLSELRERHLLLVLDNFEHLLEGADLVSALLAHAPRLTVVVTSRERLNLQAEWLFNVDGLGFPHQQPHAPVASQSLTTLMEYSAVELFVQRARQVQPALQLDEATLTNIVQICQHVAGMPLAIELAAVSTRILSVAEIERRIRANLDLLATRLRDVPTRHRSMRAVFDHSWNLLSEEERALFSHLAVFRSGWTAEAAAQVAGATLDLLTALVDKSLVRSHILATDGFTAAAPTSAPQPRFMMLEPIRGYALEQLVARGEETMVRHAHATYYLALAEAAAAQWNTPTKEAANVQLGRELNNMHAALEWAHDTGKSTLGLRFTLALWRFWRRFGYISEGRAWLARLLRMDEHLADAAAIRVRERALHAAAWLASDQHDYANATLLFEQSLALRHRPGQVSDKTNLADPLRNAAAARQARAEGNYRQAATLLEELLARYRLVGDRTTEASASLELSPDELGQALREFGTVLREQGDFVRAAAQFEQALALYRAIGDRASVTFALIGLGDVARDQGDSASVRAYCEPIPAILHEFGIQWAVGFALNNLALAAYYEHDLTRASALIHESVALFRTISADSSLSEVLITLGTILWAQGDAVAAYDALTEALRLSLAFGPRIFVAPALEGVASIVVSRGYTALAARLLARASALRTEMGTPIRPVDQVDVDQVLATTRSALGEEAFAAVWAEAQTQSLEAILSMIPSVARFNVLDERSA
jgi:predicted ATPase/transcriptional regulator with XRE-family HTH domain